MAKSNEGKEKDSYATRLVQMAERSYRFGVDDITGEPFAVQNDGPNLAIDFNDLKRHLAGAFYEQSKIAVGSGHLNDAMFVLHRKAEAHDREPVHLRVAMDGDAIIYDLGGVSGQCVRVTSSGWEVLDRSPVLFRRNNVMGVMPEPARGGSIDELRRVLHVGEDGFRKIVAWATNALVPNNPHPVLIVGGMQGASKSSTAQVTRSSIVQLHDELPQEVLQPFRRCPCTLDDTGQGRPAVRRNADRPRDSPNMVDRSRRILPPSRRLAP